MFNHPDNENPSWFDAYKSGDADRYVEVFHQYYRPIYHYATKTLGAGNPDVDDVVNQAFALAWEVRDQIATPTHLRNYLYKVIKHRGISAFRTHNASRRKALEYLKHFDEIDSENPIDFERVWTQVIDTIYKQLETLPNGHVLKMIYLDGLSTHEIATKLNTTDNNVYIMKSRALKQLRTYLGKDFPLVLLFAAFSYLEVQRPIPRAHAYMQKETALHQQEHIL